MTTALIYSYEELKEEVRLVGDPHDPFGTCMAWWFAVASVLFKRGQEVPEHWRFRPAPSMKPGDPPEDFQEEICQAASSRDLVRFGNLLCRWRSRIGYRGENY